MNRSNTTFNANYLVALLSHHSHTCRLCFQTSYVFESAKIEPMVVCDTTTNFR